MKTASRPLLYGSAALWAMSWIMIPVLVLAIVLLKRTPVARTSAETGSHLVSSISAEQGSAMAATATTSSASATSSEPETETTTQTNSHTSVQTQTQQRVFGKARVPAREPEAPGRLDGARNVQTRQLEQYFNAHRDGRNYQAALSPVLEVMNGYAYGEWDMGLESSMSRAQAATVIANTFDLRRNTRRNLPRFTDVSSSATHAYNIYALYENGVTNGCSASPRKFCPSQAITRRQFAIMFANAIKATSPELIEVAERRSGPRAYGDVSSSSTGYSEVRLVQKLYLLEHCSMQGSVPNLCPEQPLKRGEAARTIARYYLDYVR